MHGHWGVWSHSFNRWHNYMYKNITNFKTCKPLLNLNSEKRYSKINFSCKSFTCETIHVVTYRDFSTDFTLRTTFAVIKFFISSIHLTKRPSGLYLYCLRQWRLLQASFSWSCLFSLSPSCPPCSSSRCRLSQLLAIQLEFTSGRFKWWK